jgi:hypothetical protein
LRPGEHVATGALRAFTDARLDSPPPKVPALESLADLGQTKRAGLDDTVFIQTGKPFRPAQSLSHAKANQASPQAFRPVLNRLRYAALLIEDMI